MLSKVNTTWGGGLLTLTPLSNLFGVFLIVANLEIDSLYGALIKLFFRGSFKNLVKILEGD